MSQPDSKLAAPALPHIVGRARPAENSRLARTQSAARAGNSAGTTPGAPALTALLVLLLGWKSYSLLSGNYRVQETWTWLDYAGTLAQDLFAWSLVVVGWKAFQRRRGAGILWLAVVGNAMLLTQLVDARLKVRFLQPLTLEWLQFFRSEARTLTPDVSVFTGNSYWKGAVLSFALLNGVLFLSALPPVARTWRNLAQRVPAAVRKTSPVLPLLSVALFAVLSLLTPAQPYGLHRNFLAGLVLPGTRSVRGYTDHASRPSEQSVRTDLAVGSAHEQLGLATPPRNVVLYVVESMAFEATSLGSPDLDTTPFLAELARTSLSTEAYAQFSNSSKSMFSIMTGLFASQTMEIIECQVPGVTGLTRSLRDRGYRTATLTPQHLYFQGARSAFRNFGFEEISGFLELEELARRENRPFAKQAAHDDRCMLLWDHEQLATEKPFFVTYYTNSSHWPYTFPGHDPDASELDRYLASLRYTDQVLREIYAEYERLGLLEDTLFVITSDHGEGFENGRFTGRGSAMTESTHKVPLLFHVPGADVSGFELPVARHVDIFPTAMDLLGLELGGVPVQGRSLLDGQPAQPAFLNSYGTCHLAALVEGSGKYLYSIDTDELWFADLATDPSGTELARRAAGEDPDVRRRLREFTIYNEALLRDFASRR